MSSLENFVREPFTFGECQEINLSVNVQCKAFAEILDEKGQKQNISTAILIRKRGSLINMHVAGVLVRPNKTIEEIKDPITIEFGDPKVIWGENSPRLRYFPCLCRVYDPYLNDGKFVPGFAKLTNKGKCFIFPANYTSKYLTSGTLENQYSDKFKAEINQKDYIGFSSFDMNFIINDGHSYK